MLQYWGQVVSANVLSVQLILVKIPASRHRPLSMQYEVSEQHAEKPPLAAAAVALHGV